MQNVPILLEPTTTKLTTAARGAVVVSGSHGGRYPGYSVAKTGVRAVVLNDAGVGKDAAGIGSLPYLDELGIAAATVSHLSCRIGDAQDMMARGVISHANAAARAAGVRPAQPCREAAMLLQGAPHVEATPPALGESRSELVLPGALRRIVLIDSAALVQPQDAGQIVVTGSHGGLVGGNPKMALQVAGFAGIYNDAGGGIDGAGLTRLPALDGFGIAGVTVSADSARIGEARSTLDDGVVSHANQRAVALGARAGEPLAALLARWASAAF